MTAMVPDLRKTGINIVGDMRWGTHFCCFYETTHDLLALLGPYFATGLELGEFCVWVISDPLTEEDAIHTLRHAVPDLDRYLAERSIEFISLNEWYLKGGAFDLHRVIASWNEKLDQALTRGYPGVRVSGNTAWIQQKDWPDFREYEKEVDVLIANQRMIVLCTYPLTASRAAEILDVAQLHQVAVARRSGHWEIVETPELKQAKQEIQRLNAELEQRVSERTSELAATTEALRREIIERQQAEDRLRLVIDTIPAMVSSTLPDGSVDSTNQRWLEYMDLSLEEAQGWGWKNRIHYEDLARVLDDWRAALATGEPVEMESRVRRADGEYRWLLHRSVPLRDELGNIVQWYSVSTDIENRKRAEEALRASEEKFSAAFRASPVALCIATLDGKYVEMNQAFCDLLGYSREELLGKTVIDLGIANAETRQAWVEALARKGDLMTHVELSFRVRNGVSRTTVTSVETITLHGVPHRLATSLDITERKRAEEEIRRYAVRMETLAEISRTFVEAGLEYQNVLNTVAQRTAELIGDSCLITRFSEDGQRLFPVAFYHRDPKARAMLHDSLLHTWQGGTKTQRYRTLLSGKPIYLPVVNPEAFRASLEPEFLPYFDAIGVSSVLIVPLQIQGQMIGTLGISRDRHGSPYTRDDQVLVQDLADRAALTIQNAQLFEQVRGARERLQVLSGQVLQAQEAERRAIARELHDEIGQRLTGLSLLLSNQHPAPDQLTDAQAIVRDLIARLRNLSLDLRPTILDDLGLLPALVWLFERYTAQTNVSVQFEQRLPEEQRFDPDVETSAYRIVQEALTNVARHAGVRAVTVRLWMDVDTLWVVVADQGRGFDPQTVDLRSSSGFTGMQERAALLAGQLTIESAVGTGTRLTAILPLHSDAGLDAQEQSP
jgi:PAS domain S-box-containing protein